MVAWIIVPLCVLLIGIYVYTITSWWFLFDNALGTLIRTLLVLLSIPILSVIGLWIFLALRR